MQLSTSLDISWTISKEEGIDDKKQILPILYDFRNVQLNSDFVKNRLDIGPVIRLGLAERWPIS